MSPRCPSAPLADAGGKRQHPELVVPPGPARLTYDPGHGGQRAEVVGPSHNLARNLANP